jgi:hypothetical protein
MWSTSKFSLKLENLLQKRRSSLQGKRYKDVEEFLTEQFRMPGENGQSRSVIDENLSIPKTTNSCDALKDIYAESELFMVHSRETTKANHKEDHSRSVRCSPEKRDNELTYQIERKEKHIRKLAKNLID